MPAKKTPQKTRCRESKASPAPASAASTMSTATQNLINMIVVMTVSGAVLLGLLVATHF